MRTGAVIAIFSVIAATVWTGAARACENGQILECGTRTFCAQASAGEGEWITYRDRFGPRRTPNVPASGELVLVFVEVQGTFGNQRLYSMGTFKDCFWTFENTYVESNPRKILSWKRLDEQQYEQ